MKPKTPTEANPHGAPSPKPPPPRIDPTSEAPDERPRDDYERDDPDERAGLRRPRGGTPNVPRG
ncbi:hypothetical protein HLB44_14560 [Aquincola sp. S2]|uniref:Uncharacterized protein n=1 Tax=Pseudaquabacterium terrae TaxID=2732868 RepID=A0ABX2EI04_9BURK|nr:hypothetical protein [Aquabacterium terrae]NRF68212.1 hypothetical protein [Aquabacterium terrae]